MFERRGQGQPLDLLAYGHLAGSVKPDQMESLLADVDPDHGEFLKASFLLRMSCFSCRWGGILLQDNPALGKQPTHPEAEVLT